MFSLFAVLCESRHGLLSKMRGTLSALTFCPLMPLIVCHSRFEPVLHLSRCCSHLQRRCCRTTLSMRLVLISGSVGRCWRSLSRCSASSAAAGGNEGRILGMRPAGRYLPAALRTAVRKRTSAVAAEVGGFSVFSLLSMSSLKASQLALSKLTNWR